MFSSRRVGSSRTPLVALWVWQTVLLGCVGLAGCSAKSDDAAQNDAACVPGAQASCACKDGAKGAQVCREDGRGYAGCECVIGAAGTTGSAGQAPLPEAGGSGGAGGRAAVSAGAGGDGGVAGDPGNAAAGAAGDNAGEGEGEGLDFPEAPVFEPGAPANAPDLFGAAGEFIAGELCVLEPPLSAGAVPGALFPSNWLRPRFRVAAAKYDLFELRLSSKAEKHELVVYTTKPSWYLPKQIWSGDGSRAGLGKAAAGSAVTVTIRALNSASLATPIGVTGRFEVAPAEVSGSIAFSAVRGYELTPNAGTLFGFSVGDEGVASALRLPQVAWGGQMYEGGSVLRGYFDSPKPAGFADGQVRCIGCHAITPDGQSLAFTDDWPWAKGMAQITSQPGTIPSYLGRGASALLKMPWWGSQTMSAAHWQSGDRLLVTSYATTFKSGAARNQAWQALPNGLDDYVSRHQLAWIDLESSAAIDVAVTDTLDYGPVAQRNSAVAALQGIAWGLIGTGDTASVSAVSPSFDPAGDRIAYVATDDSPDGHPAPSAKTADVRIVPYANHSGGQARALLGAADPSYFEYDPGFSPDGKLVSFTRAPTGGPDGPYHNRFAQVTVVPAAGGDPVPLAANSANACAGDPNDRGLINGSASFAPSVLSRGGKTYYFLVFTSGRRYGDEFSTPFQIPQRPLVKPLLPDSTQLYLTAIVRDDASGSLTTYPALYIWNQNRTPDENGDGAGMQFANLTPSWSRAPLSPLVISPASAN